MKYTPAKSIQRIAFFFALILGLNPLVSHVYAQEVESSEKRQLLTEAINARNTGDLLLAKEKAEALVAIAPEDQEVQDLLLSLNTSIDGQSLSTASEAATTAAPEKKRSQSDVLSVAEVSPEFASQETINEELLVIARAQIKAGDYQGARATLMKLKHAIQITLKPNHVIALSKKVAQVQGKIYTKHAQKC